MTKFYTWNNYFIVISKLYNYNTYLHDVQERTLKITVNGKDNYQLMYNY